MFLEQQQQCLQLGYKVTIKTQLDLTGKENIHKIIPDITILSEVQNKCRSQTSVSISLPSCPLSSAADVAAPAYRYRW